MDAKVFEFLLKLKDGLVNPKNRNRVLGGGAAAAVGLFIWNKYSNKKPKHKGAIVEANKGSKIPSHKRAALNRHFVRMLAKLLRIIIPSWKSKEVFLLIMHSGFLLARTVASVYFATLDGQIVKALVSGEGKEFAKKIIWWLIFSIPVAFVNSMLRYLQHRLSISFRSRLTHHIHKEYMENETFYKLENLDTRIRNADQCITADVAKFCHALADLYSNLAKPSLDCIIYNAKLAHNVGFKGLFVITCLIHTGTFVLRKFTPPFGRLVAEEQRLEGNFRFAHSRIITNAEEIAFYGGSEIEKNILDETYSALVRHVDIVHMVRLNYGTLESYITKYFWGALGFLICSLPVFTPFGRPKGISGNSLSDHTKDFITNRRLLISTADAFERLIEGYKEIIELAGYTSRVYELLEVIEDVRAGHFKNEAFAPEKQHGTVSDSDIIKCDNVSIVSPNGDLLIQNLTFEVPVGAHLLITGPNGCGKSSLFRILGGLWPLLEGSVKKPTRKQIFYIPQRPYLSQGTLRDQVIYPNSLQELRAVGVTDEDLAKVLELVKLNYIVDREGGWDAKKEWKDVLSGGEKQRMAMARLFFHKPRYAILDECTSAVSIDVEGSMYNTAKELGISLITVSHRTSLWKYHTYLLEFDGNGNYRFVEIDNLSGKDSSISNLSLEEEKRILLARVQEDSQRIKKIDSLLGE